MAKTPTRSEVQQLLALRGTLVAREAGAMFDLSTETVRRIWRRETHRKVPEGEPMNATLTNSLANLENLLTQEPPEETDANPT